MSEQYSRMSKQYTNRVERVSKRAPMNVSSWLARSLTPSWGAIGRCVCCSIENDSDRPQHELEREYYLELCDDCQDYADLSYENRREVINLCMTGSR
jgi:hypothetical protein